MDADTEDAFPLMMATCKTLCQFNTMADGAFVPNGTKPKEGLLSAKEEFFHVIQFLFLMGRDTLRGAPINILTMARAGAWATLVAMDCGIGMGLPQESPGASHQDVCNLTNRVNQLMAVVTKSSEAVEARAKTTHAYVVVVNRSPVRESMPNPGAIEPRQRTHQHLDTTSLV